MKLNNYINSNGITDHDLEERKDLIDASIQHDQEIRRRSNVFVDT